MSAIAKHGEARVPGVIERGVTVFPSAIDVVFIAPGDPVGSTRAGAQRTVAFAPGQPIPRVGECVIIAFGAEPARWQVQDVAHVFEADGHGIAIKLAVPDA